MADLIDRKVRTEIFGEDGHGLSWTTSKEGGLRQTFDVQRDDDSSPNKLKLEIYNLSKESQAFIEEDTKFVRLYAGYGEPEMIFQGDVVDVDTGLKGLDDVTTIKSGDAQTAYNSSHIQKHFGGEVDIKDMIRRTGDSMIKQGRGMMESVVKFGKEASSKGVKQAFGQTLSGSSPKILDDLTTSIGSDWTVQDGEIFVFAEGDDTGEEAILLSSDTGLLKISRHQDGLRATSLLLPKARPRRLVRVDSRHYEGFYVILDLKHRGDTDARRFFTDMEVKAV